MDMKLVKELRTVYSLVESRQNLTDEMGHPLGQLEDNDGETILYDLMGRMLGSYNKRTDSTTDIYVHPVGNGNLLGMLIRRDK